MPKKVVPPEGEDTTEVVEEVAAYTVATDQLRVRASAGGPDTGRRLTRGEPVAALTIEGDWVQIGPDEWVRKEYLS
jgi:hypothetical protein